MNRRKNYGVPSPPGEGRRKRKGPRRHIRRAQRTLETRRLAFDELKDKKGYHRPGSMSGRK